MNSLKPFARKHKYVLISFILHIAVFLAATIGWNFARKPAEETLVVTVDLLPISNISNVKTKKAQKEKVVKAKKAKKTQKSIKPNKSQPPPEEKKQEPVKSKKSVKEPKKEKKVEKVKPKSKVAAPKKKDAKQPIKDKKTKKKAKPVKPKKSKEVPKKVKAKPKPKKKENKQPVKKKKTKDLDALLRTLEQSSEGNNPKSSQYKREQQNDVEHDAFGNLQEDMPLSISEKNMIKEQIRRQWNTSMVAGVRNADQIIITLSLKFEIDGEVSAVKIISMQCPGIDRTTCQAVADSALRATHLASPLDGLPPERYDIWKEINFAFTPVD